MHLESRVIDVSSFSVSKSTSSKGNQRKWSDGTIWVKAAFDYDGRLWQDYLVEIIAADIGSQLDFNVVPQGLAAIRVNDERERLGCWSTNFLPEGYAFISFQRLLETYDFIAAFDKATKQQPPSVMFEATKNIFEKITGLDVTHYLTEMLLLDYLIGNEDRHLNNFGVLWNAENREFRIAPLFDNGLGLFEHDSIYDNLHLFQAIRKMKGKPFSKNLEKAVDMVDISGLAGKVINISDLTFPNKLAEPYLRHAAEHLGLEVI